jgi:hypothetical protein
VTNDQSALPVKYLPHEKTGNAVFDGCFESEYFAVSAVWLELNKATK